MLEKNKYRIILKYFVLIFILSCIAWNWSSVSWVFDYNFLSEKIELTLKNADNVQNGGGGSEDEGKADKDDVYFEDDIHFEKENSLVIVTIGVDIPIILPKTNNENDFDRYLKQGVMYYPDSAFPGEDGQVVILGHSAPPNWPALNYYKAFSRLSELQEGDEIQVYFDRRLYKYSVVKNVIIKQGDDIPTLTNKNSLVLLSCWPPGKNVKRILVQAEQI